MQNLGGKQSVLWAIGKQRIQAKATLLERGFKYIFNKFEPKNRNSCYIFEEKRNGDIMQELLK